MQNSTPTPKSYEQLSRDYLDLANLTHSCISDLGSMLYAIQILDDEKYRFVQKKLIKIGG